MFNNNNNNSNRLLPHSVTSCRLEVMLCDPVQLSIIASRPRAWCHTITPSVVLRPPTSDTDLTPLQGGPPTVRDSHTNSAILLLICNINIHLQYNYSSAKLLFPPPPYYVPCHVQYSSLLLLLTASLVQFFK